MDSAAVRHTVTATVQREALTLARPSCSVCREIFEELDSNEDEHLDEDELVHALKGIWEHMDVKVCARSPNPRAPSVFKCVLLCCLSSPCTTYLPGNR